MLEEPTTTRRLQPINLTVWLTAAGSLVASALAIGTGSGWLTALAVLLSGTATLLRGILDYRTSRRALEEARHRSGMAKTVRQPVSKQNVEWREPFNRTFH
jgi:hypothetical protein